MTVGFLSRRAAKPAIPFPCTTRTIAPANQRLDQLWDAAEASLHTEWAADVLAEASAIAEAERSRTRVVDGLVVGSAGVCADCAGGFSVCGEVRQVGRDMLVLGEDGHLVTGIALSALLRVSGVQHRLPSELPAQSAPLTWKQWLRSIDGQVQVRMSDGWSSKGLVRYVGSDFLRVVDDRGFELDLLLSALSCVTAMRTNLPD
ncbi:MAG: hypothetical protein Q7K25_03170 [Actinomycetota bacterium]|nr:hypothetical protein [Actinomycetota bacterium]